VLPFLDPDTPTDGRILEAGRYRIPLSDTLSLDIDLPTGTEANGDGMYLAFDQVILKVEAAGEGYGVPRDPCYSFVDIAPAGVTVADLVSAIRKQPVYEVTRLAPVTIGGAEGQSFELRIPRAYDSSSCIDSQVGLPGKPSTSNNMSPGYVARWWVLDVAGERAVLQTYCDGCTPAASERMVEVVESITFTPTS